MVVCVLFPESSQYLIEIESNIQKDKDNNWLNKMWNQTGIDKPNEKTKKFARKKNKISRFYGTNSKNQKTKDTKHGGFTWLQKIEKGNTTLTLGQLLPGYMASGLVDCFNLIIGSLYNNIIHKMETTIVIITTKWKKTKGSRGKQSDQTSSRVGQEVPSFQSNWHKKNL